MKRSITLVTLIFLALFDLKGQYTVKTSHPRILLDATIIPKLQSRAAANTIEYQQLMTRISAISGYNAQYIMTNVYGGEQYAFMYALSFYANGNTAHRDSSISIFKEYFYKYTKDSSMYFDSGYESRSTMVEIAMLYDWLYNYMSPTFRNDVRARLILWADWILTKPNIYGIWTGPYYYEGNNYTMGHFVGITSVGFSIHSEDNVNGNKFISKADSIRPFLMNYTNTRLKGGDANEGWGYGAGYAVNYFKALAIFKTATTNGQNFFLTTTYDEDAAKFLPFATLPNLTHMLAEGDWARESSGELWEFHRQAADLISSYSDDAIAQQTCLFWANETVPFNKFAVTAYRWFPFLFSNKEITPLDYRTQTSFQTNYIYTDTIGTDQFIRRKGWTSNSQWVSYRAGGRYGDHAHNGSGHFSIYDNGWLLIDKNIYTSSGIEGMDSMHNCIHFHKMNNFEMYPFQEPIEHSAGVRRDLNQEYSYLWTNSAPIYKARSAVFNCVVKNERQFMYIPGIDKIAIFDITKTNNTSKNWFGLNFNGTPALNTDSTYSSYSNSQKTVYVKTCYPLNKSVVTFSNSVRVGYKTTQQQQYFMHLVSVQPNASTPPTILSVNKDNGRVILSDFYGSYHAETGIDYCILFAGDDISYNHDSLIYQVPVTSSVLHSYIAGLKISAGYYVSFSYPVNGQIRVKVSVQNHGNAILYTSSTGGILSFNVPDNVGISEKKNAEHPYHTFYNKTREEIYIEAEDISNSNFKIKIYDMLGKLILEENTQNTNQTVIPTSGLNNGIYMISIQNETRSFTKKLLIY